RGRLRVDVAEGDRALAIGDDLGEHLPRDDLTEQAVGPAVGHRCPPSSGELGTLPGPPSCRTPRPVGRGGRRPAPRDSTGGGAVATILVLRAARPPARPGGTRHTDHAPSTEGGHGRLLRQAAVSDQARRTAWPFVNPARRGRVLTT